MYDPNPNACSLGVQTTCNRGEIEYTRASSWLHPWFLLKVPYHSYLYIEQKHLQSHAEVKSRVHTLQWIPEPQPRIAIPNQWFPQNLLLRIGQGSHHTYCRIVQRNVLLSNEYFNADTGHVEPVQEGPKIITVLEHWIVGIRLLSLWVLCLDECLIRASYYLRPFVTFYCTSKWRFLISAKRVLCVERLLEHVLPHRILLLFTWGFWIRSFSQPLEELFVQPDCGTKRRHFWQSIWQVLQISDSLRQFDHRYE